MDARTSGRRTLDDRGTIELETPEDRLIAFFRVVRRALGMLRSYWSAQGLPQEHPYRQAARMVEAYLERTYGL